MFEDPVLLRTFVVVADEGNVTRAARRLALTQPAVSGHLARLEEAVGHRLFDRTARGVVLTEAGRVWSAYVTDALGRLDEGRRALDALAGLERGQLAIGGGATATTYLLPPLLERYHREHPRIRLVVREQGSRAALDAIVAGTLDVAIVTLPRSVPEDVAITPWVEDELVLIAPAGHRLAGRATFSWEELDGERMVAFEAGSAVREVIDAALRARGVATDVVVEVRAVDSIRTMVGLGMGVGFVSRFGGAGASAEEGGLLRSLSVATRMDRAPSAAARAFLALAHGERRG